MSISYDPMTGEPIEVNDTPNQEPIGYDPMTGEPIYANSQPQAGAGVGYDQMAGQQVYGGAPQNTYGNVTSGGGDFKPKKGLPKWVIPVVGGVAGVAVVAGAAAAVLNSGLFGNTNTKILAALKNTFAGSPMMEQMDYASLVEDGNYTMAFKGMIESSDDYSLSSLEDCALEISIGSDMAKGEYGITGSVFVEEIDTKLSAEIFVNQSEIALAVPEIIERTFVYDFTKEKKGYITEVAGDDEIEMVDELLKFVTSPDYYKNAQKMSDDMTKQILDVYNTWEFEKIDAEEFEINGKDKKCTGYELVLTEDMVLELFEVILNSYETYYEEQQKQMEDLMSDFADMSGAYVEELDMADALEELEDELDGMEDIELQIYLDKDQIAAVIYESDEYDVTVSVLVQGGDYPMQNAEIVLESDDEEISIAKKGEKKGNVYENEIEIDGFDEFVAEWTYDSKSGELSAEFESDGIGLNLEGTVKKSSGNVAIELSSLELDDYGMVTEISGTFEVCDKSDAKKPKYKEFDLGNADEDEFEDIAGEIEDAVYDLMY